jgi:hypothetical protein
MNTVTIYCQYFARAGGKREYIHTKHVIVSEETLDTLSQYSGSFGIEGSAGGTPIVASINSTWSDSVAETTQSKKSELTETENCIEYYENVGLIYRKMTYTYRIKGKTLEQVETEIITTYPTATKYFSPTELRTEAISDMKNRFGVDTVEVIYKLILPEKTEQPPFLNWKISHKGESRPVNSIYGGTGVMNDGRCYVARFNNVPGKVNVDVKIDKKTGIQNVSLCNFWSPGFWHHRFSGEVLTTNCPYKWKRIKRGDKIPINALGPYEINTHEMYGGHIKYAWVAKSVTGEPGRLTCDAKYYHDINSKKDDYTDETAPKMHNIKAHASWFTENNGYILVIDNYPNINGYKCLIAEGDDDDDN